MGAFSLQRRCLGVLSFVANYRLWIFAPSCHLSNFVVSCRLFDQMASCCSWQVVAYGELSWCRIDLLIYYWNLWQMKLSRNAVILPLNAGTLLRTAGNCSNQSKQCQCTPLFSHETPVWAVIFPRNAAIRRYTPLFFLRITGNFWFLATYTPLSWKNFWTRVHSIWSVLYDFSNSTFCEKIC